MKVDDVGLRSGLRLEVVEQVVDRAGLGENDEIRGRNIAGCAVTTRVTPPAETGSPYAAFDVCDLAVMVTSVGAKASETVSALTGSAIVTSVISSG